MTAVRHLRVVPPLVAVPAADDVIASAHAKAMGDFAAWLDSRYHLEVQITVCDGDYRSLTADPASTTAREFIVRAEAYDQTGQFPRLVAIGSSEPAARAVFLADPAMYRSAETEAVAALIHNLRAARTLARSHGGGHGG